MHTHYAITNPHHTMNLNIAKKIGLPEPTQVNTFRVIKPDPKSVYDGTNPSMFTIEEIIGRPAGRYKHTGKRPTYHNPGIALMYASELIVSPYCHSGHH